MVAARFCKCVRLRVLLTTNVKLCATRFSVNNLCGVVNVVGATASAFNDER